MFSCEFMVLWFLFFLGVFVCGGFWSVFEVGLYVSVWFEICFVLGF